MTSTSMRLAYVFARAYGACDGGGDCTTSTDRGDISMHAPFTICGETQRKKKENPKKEKNQITLDNDVMVVKEIGRNSNLSHVNGHQSTTCVPLSWGDQMAAAGSIIDRYHDGLRLR